MATDQEGATPTTELQVSDSKSESEVVTQDVASTFSKTSISSDRESIGSDSFSINLSKLGSEIDKGGSNYAATSVTGDGTSLHQGNVIGNVIHNYNQDPSKTEAGTRAKCIETIFVTDPTEDRARLIDNKGERVQGTCEWILNHPRYQAWDQGDALHLRVCGDTGQGKTMLSIFLTQHLETNSNSTVLYFFCDNQDKNRNSTQSVLRGFLYQLFKLRLDLVHHALSHFDGPRKSETSISSVETLWTIFENVIRDPSLGDIVCVIDALDECDTDSLKAFVNRMAHMVSKDSKESAEHQKRFKSIILSRDQSEFDAIRDFAHIDLETERDSSDIERVISARLDKLDHISGFSGHFRSKVHQKLLKNSGGTFLWVGCIMDELVRKRTTTEIWETLDKLPKGLPETYNRMLSQIDTQSPDVVSRIFGYVSLAARPLHVSELAAAFPESDPGFSGDGVITWEQRIRDHLALCSSLIQVVDNQTRFVHHSVREFLLHDSRCLAQFRVNEQKSHLDFATRCMKYLKRVPREYSMSSGRAGLSAQADISSEEFPLAKYASAYWPYHAKCSGDLAAQLLTSDNPLLQSSDLMFSWLRGWKKSASGEAWALILSKDTRSISLLHLAAFFGLTSWIPRLLGAEDDPILQQIFQPSRSQDNVTPSFRSTITLNTFLQTPIFNAVQAGHEKTAERLLQFSNICTVDDTDKDGNTPLHFVTSKAMAQLLIDQGADIDSPNKQGNTPLMEAAARDEDITRVLLDAGADVQISNRAGQTALHFAGSQGVTVALLRKGANPNVADAKKSTPLHSCTTGTKAQVLIEHGADVNAKTVRGDTPLHAATNENVIQTLLKAGADVNAKNTSGDTPLHSICRSTCADESVQLLLKAGAKAAATNNAGVTPLHEAALNKNVREPQLARTVKALLENGADINARTTARSGESAKGETPLIGAARVGSETGLRVLLGLTPDATAGAEVNVHARDNDDGWMAVHHAAKRCSASDVEMLLDAGALVNAKTRNGQIPLHICLQSWIEYLAASRPPGGLRSRSTFSLVSSGSGGSGTQVPQETRSKSGPSSSDQDDTKEPSVYAETMRLLLTRGADFDARNEHGQTPLIMAVTAETPAVEAARMFVAHGADINARRAGGWTALIDAIHMDGDTEEAAKYASAEGRARRMEAVRVLVDLGADLEVADDEGKTPLHHAVRLWVPDMGIVELLIDKGANMGHVRKDGKSVIVAAATGRMYQATHLLIERGVDRHEVPFKHRMAIKTLAKHLETLRTETSGTQYD